MEAKQSGYRLRTLAHYPMPLQLSREHALRQDFHSNKTNNTMLP